MRQHVGWYLQLAALVFLPMLIFWQLEYGFKVGQMAGLTVVGMIVFFIGTKLRDS